MTVETLTERKAIFSLFFMVMLSLMDRVLFIKRMRVLLTIFSAMSQLNVELSTLQLSRFLLFKSSVIQMICLHTSLISAAFVNIIVVMAIRNGTEQTDVKDSIMNETAN